MADLPEYASPVFSASRGPVPCHIQCPTVMFLVSRHFPGITNMAQARLPNRNSKKSRDLGSRPEVAEKVHSACESRKCNGVGGGWGSKKNSIGTREIPRVSKVAMGSGAG